MSTLFDDWTAIAISCIAGAALLGAIWWSWWEFPRRQAARLALKIRDPKARADLEDNFRKTVGQALGGVAVLVTGLFAYLQFVQGQKTSFQTFLSQQVSKGFEEIGNDKLEVRIGGIYTLEGALQVDNFYRIPVLQGLSAFVRTKATKVDTAQLEADVQAAMTVIGRNVSNTDFLHFNNIYLVRADMQRADLRNSNFSGARLDEANLSKANLSGSRLSDVNLSNARLVEVSLRRADLSRANLQGADLHDADLYLANLHVANLRGANLERAELQGADLHDANLQNANLQAARLRDANLSDANLTGAALSEAVLDAACGTNATLPPGMSLKSCP